MANPGAAWQEDPTDTNVWDTVSTKAPLPDAMSAVSSQAPLPAIMHTDSPAEHATEPTLRDILSAVTSCNTAITALTTEIKGVKQEINLVRHDMQKLRDHTTALEGRLSNVEDEVAPLQREINHLQSHSSGHSARLEDMENRLRRNNVRAVGIPKRAEGKNPLAFTENWFVSTFGDQSFSKMFAVERAHRVPAKPPRPGEPPRPFLFKVLNFKDRDAILQHARAKGDLMKIDNARISFYPDFSAEVQRRRAKFTEVKKPLRKYAVTYAMLYPAKLRVATNDETHFFENPATASAWLDRNTL